MLNHERIDAINYELAELEDTLHCLYHDEDEGFDVAGEIDEVNVRIHDLEMELEELEE